MFRPCTVTVTCAAPPIASVTLGGATARLKSGLGSTVSEKLPARVPATPVAVPESVTVLVPVGVDGAVTTCTFALAPAASENVWGTNETPPTAGIVTATVPAKP